MKTYHFTTCLTIMLTGFLAANLAAQKKVEKAIQYKSITVFETAKNTDKKLTKTGTYSFVDKPQPIEKEISVFVDPSKTYQTMLGIGGAITDASAEVFYKLSKEQQAEILTAYYDKEKGIGYTLARTNMQSCDFSSDIYSYIKEGDKDLKTFDISHDRKYRIPLIKEAIAKAGGKLTLYASPWSPPAWMKTNNNVLQGGSLKPEYQQSWANFFVKFINEYEKEGIPIWGYTVQNEPMAVQKWESCIFTAQEERDFIKNFLGPTMQKAGLSKKKLIMWDHNRDLMYQRVSTVLEDKDAEKYVWGIGYHWYEDWHKNGMNFEAERRVAEAFPNKPLILTEGCAADFDQKLLTEWSYGEKYGMSMINDFNIGTVAWTDWNILLDEKGGPNHVQNFCMSPIHADLTTGKLIYTNGYYYLGHFSKFIHPGAKRVACNSSSNKLLSTAFVNLDNNLEVVVMNQSDNDVEYFLWIKGKASKITSLAHSIATLEVK